MFDGESPLMGPIFTAGYDSDDSCCGEGIVEGERIRADGEGGWVHEDCSADEPVKPRACPECFQVPAANGSCGCR